MISALLRCVILISFLAGASSACANHPPLYGDDGDSPPPSPDSDGGRRDAGIDSRPSGAGSHTCQVRYPVAVLFYDCVDMAPLGGTTTRVCLSQEKFSGNVTAARHYVQQAMKIMREMYVGACAPLAVEPTLFMPNRVLGAQVGTPQNEFKAWSGAYLYAPDTSRLEMDITAAGDNPRRFGAYVVYNGWRSDILPSYAPATNPLTHRSMPPYSLVGVNLHEGTDPAVPANLKVALRHELDHTLENIATVNGFTRHIRTHDTSEICPDGGDARRICQVFNGSDGNSLTTLDWETALGNLGVPVDCRATEWIDRCDYRPTATCRAIECPQFPNYTPTCNPQGYCEYSPSVATSAWQLYDRWIYVPAGSSFQMGTLAGDAAPAETPAHVVEFRRGMFIGKYEVPVEAYEACQSNHACGPRSINNFDGAGWGVNEAVTRPLHPANAVNFNQAWQFCEWLAPGSRLPSEAELEFASRGPAALLYPNGNMKPTCARGFAVFNETGTISGYGCGTGGTQAVGSSPAGVSPIGAFNTIGNVSEWVSDNWNDSYTGAPSDGTSWNWGGSLFYHPVRNGGFNDSAIHAAQRFKLWYSYTNANVGIRCALTADRHYP